MIRPRKKESGNVGKMKSGVRLALTRQDIHHYIHTHSHGKNGQCCLLQEKESLGCGT